MTWLSNEAVQRLREAASRPEMSSERYELLHAIGRGGMGTVFAARDRLLERDVAIKVSHAAVAGTTLDERLRQEARVLARLEHPGMVAVHDAGRLDDGRLFYVMALVRGETLEQHAATLTSESARLAVFERVAETVAFAHAAGVVHRDLKPSNVMVGSFGQVLVLDWGIAKVIERAGCAPPDDAVTDDQRMAPSAGQTEPGTRAGTPGFMAPEQRAADVVGPAADIYALGALLYWLLAGQSPPDSAEAAGHSLRGLIPAPSRRLCAIVVKALAARPEDRYLTSAAMVDDLTRYRAGDAIGAYRERAIERAVRWFQTYRAFILLVLAYLLMRTLFAFITR